MSDAGSAKHTERGEPVTREPLQGVLDETKPGHHGARQGAGLGDDAPTRRTPAGGSGGPGLLCLPVVGVATRICTGVKLRTVPQKP